MKTIMKEDCSHTSAKRRKNMHLFRESGLDIKGKVLTKEEYRPFLGFEHTTLNPERMTEYIARAEKYLEKAVPLAEELVNKYPNNALIKGYNANIIGFQIAISPLRAATLARGMMKNAKASITLAPNDPTVNILSGNIFLYMPDFLGGDTQKSLKQYKKALATFDANETLRKENWMYLQLMVTIGIVYEKLENYTEAKKMYEKALKIYPNYPHVRDKKYPNILKKIEKK